MLIGYTERRRWRLAVIDFAASPVELLAQAFSPELFEPEREFPERLRVGEQNENSFAAFSFEYELNESRNQRRILEETGLRAWASASRAPS